MGEVDDAKSVSGWSKVWGGDVLFFFNGGRSDVCI